MRYKIFVKYIYIYKLRESSLDIIEEIEVFDMDMIDKRLISLCSNNLTSGNF